ncbi:MAG TPA: hypothetical protein VGW37_03045 [Terriglobia bacterium]|nr:hypothetical protein [Terriglobia bacterium]
MKRAHIFLALGYAYQQERSTMQKLPYLTAALLCEKVLEEKNGTLSVMRIIDRIEFQIGPGTPEVESLAIKPTIPISGLISIKSGPVTGKTRIYLDGVSPSGTRKRIMTYEVDLRGGDHGQNIIVNMVFGIGEEGLHWFEVLVEDALMTKIPLMVVRRPSEPAISPTG